MSSKIVTVAVFFIVTSEILFNTEFVDIYSEPLLIRLQLIVISDNPDRNTRNEKCCSQFSTYSKRHVAFRKADESLVCSDKTRQLLQTYIITFKNKVHLLSLISMNKYCLFIAFK
jgi:hypothetical protein